ncbi:hypothetical protein CASFOL_036907 [Castilleja foliolosa]|uniref:DUF4378 domain-containing protein n=1 Tax=Castilleja foliolosa TaxID=1961234 RepID=A0ABD3BRJ3_9LAMI
MESRLIKPNVLLLKDYLLDDMSSCSSNGFKSFPRRQCCTSTVRFLIEIDHKNKQRQQQSNNYNNNKNNCLNFYKPEAIPKLSRSKSALSALQSVISVVKRLPVAAAISLEDKIHLKKKSMFLPRSLSVKILRKSGFWNRKSSHKEIGRWKSFDQLLKEDREPSDDSVSFSLTTTVARSDECTSCNSPSSEVTMDLPNQVKNDAVELLKNGDVSSDSTSNSDCSSASTTSKQKQWPVNEDKEQSSPVSVMDFPFEDDEEVSSPYQHGLASMKGTQKKVMKKMQRFGSLAPVSLAKQFESTRPVEDDKKDQDANEDVEKQALNLLNQMDSTSLVSSNGLKIKADKLLFDFFREKISARDDREVLEEARNWINERKPRELFLGWEVSENREAYVKDMEKTKEWKLYGEEGYKELGAEVLDVLLNELLIDISS